MQKTTKKTAPQTRPVLAIEPPAPQAEESFGITGLDKHAHQFLETALEIFEKANGSNTPAEQLIHDLVFAYRWNKISHPQIVEMIDEYNVLAESLQEEIRAYLKQNPGLIA